MGYGSGCCGGVVLCGEGGTMDSGEGWMNMRGWDGGGPVALCGVGRYTCAGMWVRAKASGGDGWTDVGGRVACGGTCTRGEAMRGGVATGCIGYGCMGGWVTGRASSGGG